jgi:hypothetical protein
VTPPIQSSRNKSVEVTILEDISFQSKESCVILAENILGLFITTLPKVLNFNEIVSYFGPISIGLLFHRIHWKRKK